jgi:hypothetical protein
MASYRPARWWVWYTRIGIVITVGGGTIMLLIAAAAHDGASIPLLVIGGAWFLMGLAGTWQRRRQVQEIVLAGEWVEFRSPVRCLTVPAAEIIEISSPWWDMQRMGYLRFRTRSNGVIKVAARLQGLFDFLVELRRVNPDVKVGAV